MAAVPGAVSADHTDIMNKANIAEDAQESVYAAF